MSDDIDENDEIEAELELPDEYGRVQICIDFIASRIPGHSMIDSEASAIDSCPELAPCVQRAENKALVAAFKCIERFADGDIEDDDPFRFDITGFGKDSPDL